MPTGIKYSGKESEMELCVYVYVCWYFKNDKKVFCSVNFFAQNY